MTTSTRVFEKKGVWHSELVRVTDPGGVVVTFKGKPMESKDKKGNWFVYFECQGEDQYYNIENPEILAHIEAAPIGRPLTIHAHGTRDDASIMIEDANGPYHPDGDVGAADHLGNPGRPVEGHPNAPVQQASPDRGEPERSQHEQMYWRAVIAAKNIHERFHSEFERTLTDDERNTATTIFIQMGRG